jgi:hypothetical protein
MQSKSKVFIYLFLGFVLLNLSSVEAGGPSIDIELQNMLPANSDFSLISSNIGFISSSNDQDIDIPLIPNPIDFVEDSEARKHKKYQL